MRVWAATDSGSGYSAGVSTFIPVAPGSPVRLLVLSEGEDIVEGSGPSGTPDNQTVGSTFTVTVWATDISFNKVTSATDTITLGSDDAFSNPTLPGPKQLAGGTTSFGVFLVTAENNIDQTSLASTTVQTQAGLLLHGFHGGVEYVW